MTVLLIYYTCATASQRAMCESCGWRQEVPDGAVVVPAVTLMYSDIDIFDAVVVLFFTPVSSPVLSVVSVLSLALVGLVGSLWRSSVC